MNPGDTLKRASWDWTVWPTQWLPTEAWIVQAAARKGPGFIHDFFTRREELIAQERHDPARFGWEAPPIGAARALLAGTYQPGRFGPVLSPRYTGGGTVPKADDLLLMTGNRFGKSNFGGRLVCETTETQLSARVRCWSQSIDTSRAVQQTAVFKHLRPELRKVKRLGQFCKISYSAATGFTEETFLYPQDRAGRTYAQAWFLTYHSWHQDRTIAEGPGVTLTWCDEEVPAELLDTLRFRVGEAALVLLVTFTPITGYTDAVGQYIEGARVIECAPARRVVYDFARPGAWEYGDWLLPADKTLVEGCPPGHVPFLLEHTKVPGRYTLCPSSAWNPYIPLDELLKKLANQPLDTKLIRIFGWPKRKVRPALSFMDAHVVHAHRLPPLESLTLYQAIDPCPPPRNWFMIWLGVDAEKRLWLLAEWPDLDVGEWAVPGSDPDGKPGPGAYDGGGRGFDGYKLLILEREGWRPGADGVWTPGPAAVSVRPGNRLLDPRAASWKVPSQAEEEAKSYLDLMREPVTRMREGRRQQIAPGLDCDRAAACHVQEGNELINDWLTEGWDLNAALTPMNCPRFYINAGLPEGADAELIRKVPEFLRGGCGNTIWALRTFTGKKQSGRTDEDSACKDPVDCCKALAKHRLQHIPAGRLGGYGGWGGY